MLNSAIVLGSWRDVLRVEEMEIVIRVVLGLVFGPYRPALSYHDQGSFSKSALGFCLVLAVFQQLRAPATITKDPRSLMDPS